MWYTGQARGHSWIGYAVSKDGFRFERRNGGRPVLISEQYWENRSVMNPFVLWDARENIYRMWYSGGETYEPNAIGYAVSPDGVRWQKHPANPIFVREPNNLFERERIGACHVVPTDDGYVMFYIGYEDIDTARICVARSPDGVTRWERSRHNPILAPAANAWDAHACYKPSAIYDKAADRWMLYYNGRRDHAEYIGLATLDGNDLGFS